MMTNHKADDFSQPARTSGWAWFAPFGDGFPASLLVFAGVFVYFVVRGFLGKE
jgi:hypothetical protein